MNRQSAKALIDAGEKNEALSWADHALTLGEKIFPVLGVVVKLKVNNDRGKYNKVEKAKSQFVVTSSNVAKILDTLKEPLDYIAVLVEFFIEFVFHLEIDFIGNAADRSMFFKVRAHMFARVSFVGENCFADKVDPGK